MIAEATAKVKEYLSTKEGKRNAYIVGGIILVWLAYYLWNKRHNKQTGN